MKYQKYQKTLPKVIIKASKRNQAFKAIQNNKMNYKMDETGIQV